MDALTLTAACILCAAQPSMPANIARWEPLIAEASARFDVPESWIAGVMRVESDGLMALDGKPITSSAGAMGLMQIMPNTYAALRKQYGFGADPYDPHDNILAGAAYLKAMYLRYGYPLLFAAYLTGPAHLDHYLFSSAHLPQNVTAYVDGIVPGAISEQNTHQKLSKSHGRTVSNPISSGLFFALKPGAESVSDGTDRAGTVFISSSPRNH